MGSLISLEVGFRTIHLDDLGERLFYVAPIMHLDRGLGDLPTKPKASYSSTKARKDSCEACRGCVDRMDLRVLRGYYDNSNQKDL